jgi:hypothetical protein
MCAQGILLLLSSELIMSGVRRRSVDASSRLSREKTEVKRDCTDRENKCWGQLTSMMRRLRVVPICKSLELRHGSGYSVCMIDLQYGRLQC